MGGAQCGWFGVGPRARRYCNVHGLFRGDTLSVQASQTSADAPAAGSAAACELRSCGGDCGSVWANIQVMHTAEYFTTEPHYDDEVKKHMPYLTLEGGGAGARGKDGAAL